jgi:hypothetical protein
VQEAARRQQRERGRDQQRDAPVKVERQAVAEAQRAQVLHDDPDDVGDGPADVRGVRGEVRREAPGRRLVAVEPRDLLPQDRRQQQQAHALRELGAALAEADLLHGEEGEDDDADGEEVEGVGAGLGDDGLLAQGGHGAGHRGGRSRAAGGAKRALELGRQHGAVEKDVDHRGEHEREDGLHGPDDDRGDGADGGVGPLRGVEAHEARHGHDDLGLLLVVGLALAVVVVVAGVAGVAADDDGGGLGVVGAVSSSSSRGGGGVEPPRLAAGGRRARVPARQPVAGRLGLPRRSGRARLGLGAGLGADRRERGAPERVRAGPGAQGRGRAGGEGLGRAAVGLERAAPARGHAREQAAARGALAAAAARGLGRRGARREADRLLLLVLLLPVVVLVAVAGVVAQPRDGGRRGLSVGLVVVGVVAAAAAAAAAACRPGRRPRRPPGPRRRRLHLQPHQVRVRARRVAQQLRVRALLDDAAGPHDRDAVGVAHGRQAVRHDDRRAPFGRRVERALHHLFAARVERRRRLVQQQDFGPLEQRARESQALLLPAGQQDAALPDLRVEPLREQAHEGPRVARAQGRLDLAVARAAAAHAHVVADARGEQQRVLLHEPDVRAEPAEVEGAQGAAVQQDVPGTRVVEALDELHDGRLAAARRADERDGGACGHDERESAQHGRVGPGGVGKVDVAQLEAALHRVVWRRLARRVVRVDGGPAGGDRADALARGARLGEIRHDGRGKPERERPEQGREQHRHDAPSRVRARGHAPRAVGQGGRVRPEHDGLHGADARAADGVDARRRRARGRERLAVLRDGAALAAVRGDRAHLGDGLGRELARSRVRGRLDGLQARDGRRQGAAGQAQEGQAADHHERHVPAAHERDDKPARKRRHVLEEDPDLVRHPLVHVDGVVVQALQQGAGRGRRVVKGDVLPQGAAQEAPARAVGAPPSRVRPPELLHEPGDARGGRDVHKLQGHGRDGRAELRARGVHAEQLEDKGGRVRARAAARVVFSQDVEHVAKDDGEEGEHGAVSDAADDGEEDEEVVERGAARVVGVEAEVERRGGSGLVVGGGGRGRGRVGGRCGSGGGAGGIGLGRGADGDDGVGGGRGRRRRRCRGLGAAAVGRAPAEHPLERGGRETGDHKKQQLLPFALSSPRFGNPGPRARAGGRATPGRSVCARSRASECAARKVKDTIEKQARAVARSERAAERGALRLELWSRGGGRRTRRAPS